MLHSPEHCLSVPCLLASLVKLLLVISLVSWSCISIPWFCSSIQPIYYTGHIVCMLIKIKSGITVV